MSGALIDLGEVPRTRPAAAVTDARAPFPARLVLGLLAAVLLATLAGAAAVVPAPAAVIIPARLGDATFVDGTLLHVVSTGRAVAGSRALSRTISTYELPAARLAGQVT